MQHLNPYRFYELAAKLHALFDNTAQNRVSDMFGPITDAQAALDGWIKGNQFPLETSKTDANRLLSKIGNLFNKYYIDSASKQLRQPKGEDRIDAHELALIRGLVDKFEHALAAELNRAPTYMAKKRGIYSTHDLIENAHMTFSEDVRRIVPETSLREFDVAGRALAFGLGTAAGMHLLRAVEMVLKKYYEHFSGTEVAKTERTYSIYLKRLAALSEDEGSAVRPDKRLLQLLAQIKEHYRNPLTSPESAITVEQATSLFGLATAAITLMCEQITAKAPNGKSKDIAVEKPVQTPLEDKRERGGEEDKPGKSIKPTEKEEKTVIAEIAEEALAKVTEAAAASETTPKADPEEEVYDFKSKKAG